ncbi:HAD family hydrolase [Mycobacterium parmense]|uniref:Protein CbbY n=1 Tax=Mycobacterium parmense TaxID=185642 RepID=A0A7I7YU63_9MYCO|nr:HAD-IA family hydrolase [Mycobacterium parmense]MCV7351716.1 HAD-IA family hydrolase [Mycobacterium parmense]ORW60182.1 haloacid dehalogenase [Mycobacterium parmense]BBZ44817.1 protein CbbY [Mycobacterium parmense]
MSAVLFGSLSTLADTSELQRQAFNDAFAEHGLDWSWTREDYRSMLGSSGGARRIADYAANRGADVDAGAVHATKSRIFQGLLRDRPLMPRPGVLATIEHAKRENFHLGLVTTTSKANVSALLDSLSPHISPGTFDVVVDADDVADPKPDPSSYRLALDRLGVTAGSAVAIEDNVGGVRAATAAGLRCIAFPNENTAGSRFDGATEVADELDAARVAELAASDQNLEGDAR